jgi:hypothetical protein
MGLLEVHQGRCRVLLQEGLCGKRHAMGRMDLTKVNT